MIMHGHTHRSRTAARSGATAVRKPCGHKLHVGTCPHCQRAQLARWRAQLDTVVH